MIRLSSKGNFDRTRKFINRLVNGDIYGSLERFGRIGVDALSAATPVDTSITAGSWGYRIIKKPGIGIEWYNNSVIRGGTPIVILLQYGHGTGTGGYVQGQDFINPAIRPIFESIADEVWKEVNR